MTMDNEPRALAADILSEIITYIKTSRPTRTDGTTTQGFVYAQMRPGQMVSPRDLSRPWSPIGPSAATTLSATTPGATPPAGTTAPASPSEAVKRAMNAAFNTAQICDTLLVVTDDSTMATYSGGGRRLDVVYPQLLAAMECPPPPERPADQTARIAEARQILWDADGNATKAYDRYLKNQMAYATAVANFVREQNKLLSDPAQADSTPVLLAPHQVAVDQAYDKWKSDDADTIEGALATVESLGVPLEQGMIANARKLLQAWSVNIGGVAAKTPYTYVLPSDWAAIETDDIGWTKLTRETNSYQSHYDRHGYSLSTGQWQGEASSTNVDAGVGIFGFGFSASHSESSQSDSSSFSQTSHDGFTLTSDAQNLSISLEYGLCRIVRPWLVTDLFRMRNWYLRGEKAGVISDGTIVNQVGQEEPLLPMLPTHFLVIRNVRISSSKWGSVRDGLTTYWANQRSQSSSSSSSTSGGVSIPVFSCLSLSAGAGHSDSSYQGDFKDESGSNCRDDYGSYYEGDTLCVNGAQIVAWLGEIVPASPPLADPSLATG